MKIWSSIQGCQKYMSRFIRVWYSSEVAKIYEQVHEIGTEVGLSKVYQQVHEGLEQQ